MGVPAVVVTVHNGAGVTYATTSDVTQVTCALKLNGVGSWGLTIPAAAAAADALTAGRYVTVTEDGATAVEGIVASVARGYGADGAATLEVSGDDLARELVEVTAGLTELADGDEPATVTAALAALQALCAGWTFAAAGSVGSLTVYLALDGASVWAALASVAEKVGAFVVRGSGRTVSLAAAWTASGLTARAVDGDEAAGVAPLAGLKHTGSAGEVVTDVYPFGAGNGRARLSLAAATESLPSGFSTVTKAFATAAGGTVSAEGIRNDAAYAAYGKRERMVQFPDISPIYNTGPDIEAAANALQAAAVEYLRQATGVAETYALTVLGGTRLGLMESLAVSHGPHAATVNVVGVKHAWRPGQLRESALEVTTGAGLPVRGTTALAQALAQARTYAAHAQLQFNGYVIPFFRPVDVLEQALFRWRFDEAVTVVKAVSFDYRLGPLESTVRSVAGTTATSTAADAHTHSVTFAGHSHYVTLPDHAHAINVEQITGTVGNPVGMDGPNLANMHFTIGSGVSGYINVATTDDGGGQQVASDSGLVTSLTSSSGGGHSHTVTPELTAVYGIYRDDESAVFAAADLEYSLDGSTWASMTDANNSALGDGWRRLELTALLIDAATGRPTAAENTLRIRAAGTGLYDNDHFVGMTAAEVKRYNDDLTLNETVSLSVGEEADDAVAIGGTLYTASTDNDWIRMITIQADMTGGAAFFTTLAPDVSALAGLATGDVAGVVVVGGTQQIRYWQFGAWTYRDIAETVGSESTPNVPDLAMSTGAIWFVDNVNRKIKKCVLGGSYTRSTLVTLASGQTPETIDVMPDGRLVVGVNTGSGWEVRFYSQAGALLTSWSVGYALRRVTADAGGVLYLVDQSGGKVEQRTEGGTLLGTITVTGPRCVAVRSTTGNQRAMVEAQLALRTLVQAIL